MEITQKQIDQRRKKWLKLAKRRSAIRFNQKKFIKRFATYKKNSDLFPTNSDHEFNYYAAVSKTFDWKEKTQEEIEDMKKEVQWKAFEEIEAVETIEKPEMKRSFWRNKKPEKDKMNFNEMWIFSDGSGKTIAVTEAVDDSDGSTDQDRTLWKTSKMSLPVTLNEKSYRYKLQNTNLLWRSLEHIQQLYEENCGQEITEIFDFEARNPANDESPKLKGDSFFEKNPENGPSARKARLSRWNFLRYDSGGRQSRDDELPKPSKSLKTKSYSMFFVRKKNYPRSEGEKNVSDRCLNEFDDYSSKESCNCSCCSCDTCLNDSTETSENSTKESRLVQILYFFYYVTRTLNP